MCSDIHHVQSFMPEINANIFFFIVREHLCNSPDPGAALRAILSKHSPSDPSTDTRADHLYLEILLACDWDNQAFVKGYTSLTGTIIAAKTTLTMSALKSLHRGDLSLPVDIDYLSPLSPLITGVENDDTPVKTLHPSLTGFLVDRARSLPPSQKHFLINIKEHNQRLGLMCLVVLKEELQKCKSALGHLANSKLTRVPDLPNGVVSEELWYACRFWIDHVVQIDDPEETLLDALDNFLFQYIVPWLEVVSSKGRVQDLSRVRAWLQVRILAPIVLNIL
jgi:hypothetical protein